MGRKGLLGPDFFFVPSFSRMGIRGTFWKAFFCSGPFPPNLWCSELGEGVIFPPQVLPRLCLLVEGGLERGDFYGDGVFLIHSQVNPSRDVTYPKVSF